MTVPKGVDCISRRDRVHYPQCTDRIDSLSWVNKPSLRDHEDGVMSCFSHFLARGLPVAAGWRSWEQLKESGISPDGMVFLERSPYGPTWAYFEYERTAGGEARRAGSSPGTAQPTGGMAVQSSSSAGTMMPSPSSRTWGAGWESPC